MKNKTLTILALLLIAFQSACNFPSVSPGTPAVTAAPAKASPSPLPPTAIATQAPPTATQAALPTIDPTTIGGLTTQPVVNTPKPTATVIKATSTRTIVVPAPDSLFTGRFVGGTFKFRIKSAPGYLTLKEVNLTKAKCNSGKTASDHMTFEDITYFKVEDGAFSMAFDTAEVSGWFDTPTTAHGSITVTIKSQKSNCVVGPVGWTATAAAAAK